MQYCPNCHVVLPAAYKRCQTCHGPLQKAGLAERIASSLAGSLLKGGLVKVTESTQTGTIPPDALPLDLQSLAEKTGTTNIVVEDESGQQRTYHSWDDVPAELRERFEEWKRQGGKGTVVREVNVNPVQRDVILGKKVVPGTSQGLTDILGAPVREEDPSEFAQTPADKFGPRFSPTLQTGPMVLERGGGNYAYLGVFVLILGALMTLHSLAFGVFRAMVLGGQSPAFDELRSSSLVALLLMVLTPLSCFLLGAALIWAREVIEIDRVRREIRTSWKLFTSFRQRTHRLGDFQYVAIDRVRNRYRRNPWLSFDGVVVRLDGPSKQLTLDTTASYTQARRQAEEAATYLNWKLRDRTGGDAALFGETSPYSSP